METKGWRHIVSSRSRRARVYVAGGTRLVCKFVVHIRPIILGVRIEGMNQNKQPKMTRLMRLVQTCYLVQELYDGPQPAVLEELD